MTHLLKLCLRMPLLFLPHTSREPTRTTEVHRHWRIRLLSHSDLSCLPHLPPAWAFDVQLAASRHLACALLEEPFWSLRLCSHFAVASSLGLLPAPSAPVVFLVHTRLNLLPVHNNFTHSWSAFHHGEYLPDASSTASTLRGEDEQSVSPFR